MREIVLDTETTGLDFRSGDRVIEVGCVELLNYVSTGKTLQFYCSTEKRIHESASKIHGLTNDFLNNHKKFKDEVQNLLTFIKNDTLIIHNSDFDMGFLNNELAILGIAPLKNKVVDTVSLARKTLNSRIANLDFLCRRFSIDLSERNLHGALLDSQLLAEVYLELKGGKQSSMNLQNKNEKIKKMEISNNQQQAFSKITLSDKDILEHKTTIKQIKNSLWEKISY